MKENNIKKHRRSFMEDEEYKMQIAYTQVYAILSLYNQELLQLRIPKEVLDDLKNNSAKDYEYIVDPNNFDPNTLTEESSALLLIIFEKYFANKTQKEKINRFLNPEHYENYDSDLLFKNRNNNIEQSNEECKEITIYESNIIKRILNKIKLIFQKKENMSK